MNHEEGERSNQNHSAELSGNTGHLVRDLAASLVVFLIASPLCMGIAIASGLPRRWGLPREWSAGLSLEQFPALPSRVSGPAAGLSVIVFELVHDLGPPMLGPILLLAGLIQFVCGRLKLGQWFRAISPAIVYGMLAGIGILIIAGQFHVMVADKPRASGLANLPAIPESILKGVFPEGTAHHLAAALRLLTLAAILLWNWLRPKSLKIVPGSLVGVVLATAVSGTLQLPVNHVEIPGNIWSDFTLPAPESLARPRPPHPA